MVGSRCMADRIAGQYEVVADGRRAARCRRRAGRLGVVRHMSGVLVRHMFGLEVRRTSEGRVCRTGGTAPGDGQPEADTPLVWVEARLMVGRQREGASHMRGTVVGVEAS